MPDKELAESLNMLRPRYFPCSAETFPYEQIVYTLRIQLIWVVKDMILADSSAITIVETAA